MFHSKACSFSVSRCRRLNGWHLTPQRSVCLLNFQLLHSSLSNVAPLNKNVTPPQTFTMPPPPNCRILLSSLWWAATSQINYMLLARISTEFSSLASFSFSTAVPVRWRTNSIDSSSDMLSLSQFRLSMSYEFGFAWHCILNTVILALSNIS